MSRHLARYSATRIHLQPSCANRHSTWPEAVLHYAYRDAVTPELVYQRLSVLRLIWAAHCHFSMLILLLFPTRIPVGVGTTCFSSCCDKDSAFITTGRLTSTLLKTGVGANDCKCSRDQRLNVPSEARRSSR
jgi:hypothetical protein